MGNVFSGKEYRRQRIARDLYLSDVAGFMGITPAELSGYERGLDVPDAATRQRLWASLERSPPSRTSPGPQGHVKAATMEFTDTLEMLEEMLRRGTPRKRGT